MSTEMDNFDQLFNPQVEIVNATKTTEEYQPSAAKGKNNVYQSIIRFIPWYQSPKHSIKEKWTCWLVDPITQKGKYVDCPSSVGKPSPLSDIYWKLKKSESVIAQKQAEIFSRKHSYASLIQVIKDENNPELEGKVLVWKYGTKIWEKINAEIKPILGESQDPFDIINGKAFALIITKVSGYNNYDQSKFVDKRIPLCIPDEQGKLKPITATSDKKMVFEWVKTNSPDLSKYEYKDWDQDIHDYVNHVIVAVTGQASQSTATASIRDTNKQQNTFTPPTAGKATSSGISAANITVEDLNLDLGTSNLPDLGDLPSIGNLGNGIGGDLDDILAQS